MNHKSINQQIVEVAQRYIGKKEIPGNQGWEDKSFQVRMESMGWMFGWAWCAVFAELVWRMSYWKLNRQDIMAELGEIFSASVMKTYYNFKEHQDYVVDKKPEKGSLIVYQKYKDNAGTNFGHMGIVTSVNHMEVETIEGNTNGQGDREGDEVAEKVRLLNFNIKENGLVLKGFIHPKIVA